jgi:hypothetical protein
VNPAKQAGLKARTKQAVKGSCASRHGEAQRHEVVECLTGSTKRARIAVFVDDDSLMQKQKAL